MTKSPPRMAASAGTRRKGDRRGLSFRGRGDISVENFGKRKNNGKAFSGIRKCERALICFNQFFFQGFFMFFPWVASAAPDERSNFDVFSAALAWIKW